MQDMLVRLYDLPNITELAHKLESEGIVIRPALVAEKALVVEWIRKRWDDGWASEGEMSFASQPVSCLIAVREGIILGFACYDVAYKNFFGPTAVEEELRGQGIGKVLLVRSLEAMKAMGYAYGIIGGVGPADYYVKAVGAKLIEGSNPGIYKGIMSYVPV